MAVGNIVRRVLKIIREVARGELSQANKEDTKSSEEYSEDDDENDEKDEDEDEEDISSEETNAKKNRSFADQSFLSQSSMFNLLSDGPVPKSHDEIKNTYNLKPLIIQEINEEIIADLESVYKGIADQAADFIHAK